MAQTNERRPDERGRTDTTRSVPTERERETHGQSRGTGLTRSGGGGLGWNIRDPFSLMNALRRDMDELFGNFGLGSPGPSTFSDIDRSGWAPAIEMYEKDGKLMVCADLPGMSKDDVHVDVRDNVLTIEGERKNEQRDEKGGWSERSYGRFFRSISLPEGVSAETAKASFKNGVLEIALDAPKRDKGGKRIEITE